MWSLDMAAGALGRVEQHLSPDEIQRADRFVMPIHQVRFRAGRGRMREILGGYADAAPEDLHFSKIENGKPILNGGPSFNLSHSGSWAMLAVAPQHPKLQLGVDIEKHRSIERDLPERFFSPNERSIMQELQNTDWTTAFFQIWTRKEAVIKATGTGLSADLKGFDVSCGSNSPQVTRAVPPMPKSNDWSLHNLELGPSMAGALAVVSQDAPVTLRYRELPEPIE